VADFFDNLAVNGLKDLVAKLEVMTLYMLRRGASVLSLTWPGDKVCLI
jgi:hypothetical protein